MSKERSIPPPVTRAVNVPEGWAGPLTPDGDTFHDLSNYSSKPTDFPDRALRYVVPDPNAQVTCETDSG